MPDAAASDGITIAQAAVALGISERTLRRALREDPGAAGLAIE